MQSENFFADEHNREWVSTLGEPHPSLPRTTFTAYKARFRHILRLFIIVVPLIGYLLSHQISKRQELSAFLANSLETQGIIQECENLSIFSKGIDYTYTTPDLPNGFYSGYDGLHGACAEQETGTPLTVRYLTDEPEESRITQGIDTDFSFNNLAIGSYLLQLVGVTLLAFRGWEQMRRFSRLETGGQIVRGSVIDTSTSWWRYPWVSIRYQFTKPDGQVIEGRRSVHLRAMEQKPEPGVPVMVLYIDDRTHWML